MEPMSTDSSRPTATSSLLNRLRGMFWGAIGRRQPRVDGALNIPHLELRRGMDEVSTAAGGRAVSVHCASGVRSYLAARVLLGAGFDARDLSGGWLTLKAVHPHI